MKSVKIIGVPEHFNLPWHLAIEEGAFEQRGIDLQWTDVPEGTGKMCQMLANEETDLAIILTEGIIKSITEGNSAKIVQEYIASPLLWGVHVSADSDFNTLNDLENKKVAISRYGSGSHLMAFVQAQNKGWNPAELQFEVINNLEGAVKGLRNGDADYFMWEHFTTKPLVDTGVFRRLGDCPTPWPCFMLVGTNKFLNAHKSLVQHIVEVINLYTTEFKNIPSIDKTLANRYQQQLEDIQEWMGITTWSQKQLPEETLEKVQQTLLNLDLIEKKLAPDVFLLQ
ncbi:substrate-binding domain-containing protein [Maribacter thermophilus]|uniref:substrate-binding domain-containing protein n=1 Tax=Maribacter thermophilus TaxID=1197874 RepID=UPI0006413C25|nr:substrate-binding domain-containing protein [Maribacter thermophilus]